MHRRGLVVATTVSMLGPLVPFLVGALAVTLRSELAMTSAGIGLAIACFFVASAVASIPAGRMIERVGAGRSTAIAGGLNGIALMAMSTLVHGQGSLIGAMAAAGVGNAIAHPAVNAAIAGRVDSRNHGLILGLKQAAVPGALVIAGLTVPLSLT